MMCYLASTIYKENFMKFMQGFLGCAFILTTFVSAHAAVKIDSTKRFTCDELNQLWDQTTDGIVLVGKSKWPKREYHQNRQAAWKRGACPRGAEEFTNFVRSSDLSNCAFGVICE